MNRRPRPPRVRRHPPAGAAPTGWRRLLRRPLAWTLAALGTVAVTVAGGWLATFGGRLLDPGKTAERVTGAPAFTSVVEEITFPLEYVLPDVVSAPAERTTLLTGAGGHSALRALVERHRGATARRMDLRIVLLGRRDGVRIVDAAPRIRAARPVPTGTRLVFGAEGEADTIELSADLDRPRPVFTRPKDRRTPYFRKHNIDLKRDEQVTLLVTLEARRRAYDVDLRLSYVEDGVPKTMDVPGNGRVLRVSGTPRDRRAYRERYEGGKDMAFRRVRP
ncbi:hypothetical protein ACSNOI_17935 [Actinomadura kijaniata]|uniref:hypothetical protein n=1 Tax=Actinomadura kijaniata TaxID=46161 RepID=UPI003F1A22B2